MCRVCYLHSALDSVWGGINDAKMTLAKRSRRRQPELSVTALVKEMKGESQDAEGRLVKLPTPMSVLEQRIKKYFGFHTVRFFVRSLLALRSHLDHYS
jgi:hypothetical protein